MMSNVTRRSFMKSLIAGVGALGLGGFSDRNSRKVKTMCETGVKANGEGVFPDAKPINKCVGEWVKYQSKEESVDGLLCLDANSDDVFCVYKTDNENTYPRIAWVDFKHQYGILNGKVVRRV
jgi:hypothetical protein